MQKRLKIKLHEAKDLPRDEDFARDDKEDQNDSLPNTSISIYVTEKYINRPKTLQGIFISLEIIINHDILQLNRVNPLSLLSLLILDASSSDFWKRRPEINSSSIQNNTTCPVFNETFYFSGKNDIFRSNLV